ncbi:MAG: tRNA (guanosine(37)-N1)-methyltransferase TrmD [Candidatus Edwardsbacteria bacterium]
MKIDVLTIFPQIFSGTLSEGPIRIAQEKGLLQISLVNLRDFTSDRHKTTDDYPYGGGPGMVMKPEPIFLAVRKLKRENLSKVILLTPQGTIYTQEIAKNLAERKHLILICGRYKAIDERVKDSLVDEEISIGDFVLSGGEIPALLIIDSIARLLPGVLSDFESAEGDSFHSDLLDAPYYTRPEEFEGMKVPKVLLSGNHEKIRFWRKKEALKRTLSKRPDLLEKIELTEEDRRLLNEIETTN